MSAHLGRACYAHLSAHKGTLPNLDIMSHLYEIVELRIAADDSRTHHGTIDSGISTNLHIVFDDNIAYLREFLVHTLGIRFKSKTIATNDYARVQNTIFSNHAIIVDLHPRIEDGVIANLDIITYIGMWIDLYPFTQLDILTNIRKGTNIRILGHNNTFADETWLLDALFSRIHGFGH